MAQNQNITLSVPRDVLKRVKRLAADRETSVSALMTEALSRLADDDRRYPAVRRRALAAMTSARSLGTRGQRAWTRDELHDRSPDTRVRPRHRARLCARRVSRCERGCGGRSLWGQRRRHQEGRLGSQSIAISDDTASNSGSPVMTRPACRLARATTNASA